jgi:AcrR family transcriptional regulator
MSLREVGKSRRRHRIRDAARARIESGGAEEFSIKGVAEAAEVSVATVYNLFGSREGLLIALLMESILGLEARLDEIAPANPIDRIAAISDLAVAEFIAEEDFYRPLLRLIEQMDSRVHLLEVIRRCVDLGNDCIGEAIEVGDLQSVVGPRVLAHQIFMAFVHALRMWSSGTTNSDLFGVQVAHFRTLMLAGVATDDLRSELHEQLRSLEVSMVEVAGLATDATDSLSSAPSFLPSQKGAMK